MIACREELEKALGLCATGCNEEGCVYLEKANAITQERYDVGNFDSVTCIELIARDVLELMKGTGIK